MEGIPEKNLVLLAATRCSPSVGSRRKDEIKRPRTKIYVPFLFRPRVETLLVCFCHDSTKPIFPSSNFISSHALMRWGTTRNAYQCMSVTGNFRAVLCPSLFEVNITFSSRSPNVTLHSKKWKSTVHTGQPPPLLPVINTLRVSTMQANLFF